MIGIAKSSLPDAATLDARAALRAAAGMNLEGVLFSSLFDLSPTLDPQELQAVRDEADRLGLHMSAGLGMVNPALPFRGQVLAKAGEGDFAAGLRRLIRLAAAIGIHEMFFVIGMIEERFSEAVSWQAQRKAVVDLLVVCAPVLRECGSRLLLKTHEEIATAEVVELVRAVGPDLLGIAFDPVNVVCRMEDPMEAARRVAPHVAQLHVDDAVVRFQEGGIRRFLAPMGEGVLDWPAIMALMPGARLWIEMHRGQFAMPVFDAQWLAAQPGIELDEYASVMSMAFSFGERDVPWNQDAPVERLSATLEKLRF